MRRKFRIVLGVATAATLFLQSCQDIVNNTPNTIDGEWKCEENHYETGKQTYVVRIEYSDAANTSIKIYNFNYLTGFSCNATISGSNITIPSQTIDNHKVDGSGTISANRETINLTYTDDPYGDGGGQVTAKYTRYE